MTIHPDDVQAYHDEMQRLRGVRNGDQPPDEPHDDEPLPDWLLQDLAEARRRGDVPRPLLVKRTDHRHLGYAGRTHQLQGASESCKTWLACLATLQAIRAGKTVLWLDYEDDARTMAARLAAMGATDDELARVHYLAPESPMQSRHRVTRGGIQFSQLLHDTYYDLAVIDGVTEAMTMEGLDLLDNADIAHWQHLLPRRLARLGSCVFSIDHLVKASNGGRFAIGGQHKLAGITGAVFRLDVVRPFHRARGDEPIEAIINIIGTKDRPGWVRAASLTLPDSEFHAATFRLTSYPDGTVEPSLDPPNDADIAPEPNLKVAGILLRFLRDYPGSTKNQIELGTRGKTETKRDTLDWLVSKGWVAIEQKGASHRHTLTDAGIKEVPE